MSLTGFFASIVSVGLMGLAAGVASGQDYPNKPIRIITAAAGGGSDFAARQIVQGIAGALGQTVIVDNRATGITSAEAASKAPPDGYSLLITGTSFWVQPLMQKMPYDAMGDFSPIVQISREVNILAVHPSLPAKSVKELVALARARPRELNYSSSTPGSSSHLASELFKSMASINVVNVPYKGSALAVTGLISGEVQLTIIDAGLLAPHIKSGRLRALAVTSGTPSALVSDLPTVAASGLPGYEAVNITGMFAPTRTPMAIIDRLNREIARFLKTSEARERYFNAGMEIVGGSAEEFVGVIKSDTAKWGRVIKDAGIKIQ